MHEPPAIRLASKGVKVANRIDFPDVVRSPWGMDRGSLSHFHLLLPILLIALIAGGFIGLAGALSMGLAGLLTSRPASQPHAQSPTILVVVPGDGRAVAAEGIAVRQSAPLALDKLVEQRIVVAETVSGGAAAQSTPAVPSAAQVVPATRTLTYRALFQEIGRQYGIDWRLLAAQAYRESSLDPAAVGRDSDLGLMQILPATWNEWAPKTGAIDPFEPYSNVHVAAAYLVYLQEYMASLDHPELYWVLTAYNWGPDNVRRLLQDGGEWYQVPVQQRRYAADILEAAFGNDPLGTSDGESNIE